MSGLADILNKRGYRPPETPAKKSLRSGPAAATPRDPSPRAPRRTGPESRTCIVHAEIAQGTPEWQALRAGIPTASNFARVVTGKGAKSEGRETYLNHLLAERIVGHPIEAPTTKMMDRGSGLEAEAVRVYEFQQELDTVKVGFVTNAAGTIGASPDRLVGDHGLLEVKAPSAAVHMSYLRRTDGAYSKYRMQVQGQLWIAQRDWADTLSYHPEISDALYRVDRDDAFIDRILAPAIEEFSAELEAAWQECIRNGWIRKDAPAMPKSQQGAKIPGMKTLDELVADARANGFEPPEWAA